MFVLETVTVAALTVLIVLGVLGLVMEIPALIAPPFLGAQQLGHVLDHVLAVFILIELLATAVAYIRGVDVIRRVLEAMLVALARKVITLDLDTASFPKVGALALLLVALGVAWVAMQGRREHTPAHPPQAR